MTADPGPRPWLAPARGRGEYGLQLVLFTLLLLLADQLGSALAGFHGRVAPLWIPTGVALAGLLLLGPGLWPALILAQLIALRPPVAPIPVAISIAGNLLAAVIPAILIRRDRNFDPGLQRLPDVLRLVIFGALLGPALGSGFGVFADKIVPQPYHVPDLSLWVVWLLGGVSSVVLLTPVLLTLLGGRDRLPTLVRGREVATIVGGLLLLGLAMRQVSALYAVLAFPLVVWAALRDGPRGSALAALAVVGLTFTAAEPLPTVSRLELQIFFAALHLTQAVTGLLLAASVAERRRARELERQTDDAYRTLIAASPLAIAAVDIAGRVTLWSGAAERMFGWGAAEVLGQPVPTLLPEEAGLYDRLREAPPALRSGEETVRRRKDGRELDVLQTTWPLYDAAGRLSGVMGVSQDITERKRAERRQAATYRVSQAAMLAPDLDQLYAALHEIVRAQMPARDLYIALYDHRTDTISFPYWVDSRDPRPEPRPLRSGYTDWILRRGRALRLSAAREGLEPEAATYELIGTQPSDWLGVPLQAGGRTIGVLAVQTYVTGARYGEAEQAILEFVSSQVGMAIERKRAETALRQSEERFRLLAEATDDLVWEWDVPRRAEWWSDNLVEVLGYTGEELSTTAAWEARIHPEDRERVSRGFHGAVAGPPASWRDEYRFQHKDGRWIWLLERLRFERDASGRAVRVLGAMMDVSSLRETREALRRSEDQLRHAMKMEAVGRLAGGVAHDFNNLLTSVLGHADLALERIPPGDPLYDDLLEIKAAGTRAAALTRQLLAFSRKQVLEPRVVDLNQIVSSVARMLRRTIGEDIELVTRLSPDLGRVRADPTQMEQVLLNLAVNARDAMPAGGCLTIETINHRTDTGLFIRIRVEDNGMGMDDETRTHIFEPFFTTKELGKGTGLGLATAYGIVEQSGGVITVQSEVGRGSTFLIDLPQVSGEPLAAQPPLAGALRGGDETILLVEDEEAVRTLTRRVLEQQGYRVLSAVNGEAALELLEEFALPLQLLLTDVVMPGMSGIELAERLSAERPGLRRLFMSGYAANTLEHPALFERDSTFLQKPFTTTQLVRRVREILDAGRETVAAPDAGQSRPG